MVKLIKLINRLLHGLCMLIMLTALLAAMLSVIVLLNFTAPNPTGRRYSSEVPLTTGEGHPKTIGNDGEDILAHDLGVVNNNASGQMQCFCDPAGLPAKSCNTCLAYPPEVSISSSNYFYPDFITDRFIADSKNTQKLTLPDEQLAVFASAARILDRPLWIYVRVNTVVDPALETMIEMTNGDVVYYFTVPDYVDPVDQMAQRTLVVSVMVFGGGLFTVPLRRRQSSPSPSKPTRPGKLRDAEVFAAASVKRARRELDRYAD